MSSADRVAWRTLGGSDASGDLFFSGDQAPREFHFDPLGSRFGTLIVGCARASCCSQSCSWSAGSAAPGLCGSRQERADSHEQSPQDRQSCSLLGKRSEKGAGGSTCSRPEPEMRLPQVSLWVLGLGFGGHEQRVMKCCFFGN